jgi:hypothetical protein
MYSREEFDRLRSASKATEEVDLRWLGTVAVGGGFGQLILIRWADRALPHARAIAIESAVFLVYIAAVILLIWRVQRHKRTSAPKCPRCGAVIEGLSTRIAIASGHCDQCGGRLLTSDT